ncbi:hypothetical protein [Nannocystis sp. SCPEA4]|uniref:hypothetical protein n=1 Tax=Nannocystis sp. SCPEA4 TaxID=2996787 RepID=UPI0022709835|nr:hypothetical protein [Nannocystis sp. SCPEA4]MCY1060420.1 hypothetical protein [Nannocystis sp. SCPEA4]
MTQGPKFWLAVALGAALTLVPFFVGCVVVGDDRCCHDRQDNAATATNQGKAPTTDSASAAKTSPCTHHYRLLLSGTIPVSLSLFFGGVWLTCLAIGVVPGSKIDPAGTAAEIARIREEWDRELTYAANRRSVTASSGIVFAILAGMVPSLCAVMLLYIFSLGGCVAEGFKQTVSTMSAVGLAALSAALTGVTLAGAELVARISQRDITSRAFGSASRSLLLSTICAVVLAVIFWKQEVFGPVIISQDTHVLI